ncbi:DMT family transporter, partial [Cloacibacillus porcorum]
ALRMLIAAFFLILMFPKTILTSTRRDWGISLIQTSILTCVFVSLTFGLVYSTASKQAFIGGLNVILVPVFVWILYKVRPSGWLFAGAGVTTVGLLVMGFTPGMEFNFGDLLSFIMAIFYAAQVLGADYCARRVEPTRLVALHIIMLAVILAVLALIFEPIPNPLTFSKKIWASLLCVSLCNTILCFILQFRAQKKTSATHAAVIFSLEGLFGYILAVASGQDPFHLQGALGGVLIIIGMLITELEGFIKARREQREPATE